MPLAPVPATRVPRSALTFSSGGDLGVRIVNEDDKVGFVPVSVVEDEQTPCGSAAFPTARASSCRARTSCAKARRSRPYRLPEHSVRRQALPGRNHSRSAKRMSKLIDYAIEPRAPDARDAAVPAARGPRRLCDDPEGGRAGRQGSDHLRAARRSAASARRIPSGCCCGRSRPSSSRSATSRRCARPRSRAAATCCSNSRPASIPSRRSPTCAPRSTRPSTTCRKDADEPQVHEVNLSLYPVLVVALVRRRAGAHAAAHRAHRQERDRAGAGRALGRAARRARRGGRDHRRADADEELRRLARSAHPRSRRRSNSLIAAGALEGATGRFAVKVPA